MLENRTIGVVLRALRLLVVDAATVASGTLRMDAGAAFGEVAGGKNISLRCVRVAALESWRGGRVWMI